jgi:hypothetical protein
MARKVSFSAAAIARQASIILKEDSNYFWAWLRNAPFGKDAFAHPSGCEVSPSASSFRFKLIFIRRKLISAGTGFEK